MGFGDGEVVWRRGEGRGRVQGIRFGDGEVVRGRGGGVSGWLFEDGQVVGWGSRRGGGEKWVIMLRIGQHDVLIMLYDFVYYIDVCSVKVIHDVSQCHMT